MPVFRISVANETFDDSNEYELASIDAARVYGIKGALAIGADEVSQGKSYFGAVVSLERDGTLLGRFVVSVGASPLL